MMAWGELYLTLGFGKLREPGSVRKASIQLWSRCTLTENQSLRVNGSWVLFLRPFLPFERRLFLM